MKNAFYNIVCDSFDFIESLKIILIILISILMIAAKLTTPVFCKIIIFWKTFYDINF